MSTFYKTSVSEATVNLHAQMETADKEVPMVLDWAGETLEAVIQNRQKEASKHSGSQLHASTESVQPQGGRQRKEPEHYPAEHPAGDKTEHSQKPTTVQEMVTGGQTEAPAGTDVHKPAAEQREATIGGQTEAPAGTDMQKPATEQESTTGGQIRTFATAEHGAPGVGPGLTAREEKLPKDSMTEMVTAKKPVQPSTTDVDPSKPAVDRRSSGATSPQVSGAQGSSRTDTAAFTECGMTTQAADKDSIEHPGTDFLQPTSKAVDEERPMTGGIRSGKDTRIGQGAAGIQTHTGGKAGGDKGVSTGREVGQDVGGAGAKTALPRESAAGRVADAFQGAGVDKNFLATVNTAPHAGELLPNCAEVVQGREDKLKREPLPLATKAVLEVVVKHADTEKMSFAKAVMSGAGGAQKKSDQGNMGVKAQPDQSPSQQLHGNPAVDQMPDRDKAVEVGGNINSQVPKTAGGFATRGDCAELDREGTEADRSGGRDDDVHKGMRDQDAKVQYLASTDGRKEQVAMGGLVQAPAGPEATGGKVDTAGKESEERWIEGDGTKALSGHDYEGIGGLGSGAPLNKADPAYVVPTGNPFSALATPGSQE